MNKKDIYVRMYVYHSIQWNWGRGVVIKIRERDNLGYKTQVKYFVKWESDGKATWCKLRDLRKTPIKTLAMVQDTLKNLKTNKGRILHQSTLYPQLDLRPDGVEGVPNLFYPNEYDGPSD